MAAALSPIQKKWQAQWIGWSGLHEPLKDLPPFSAGLEGLHIASELYELYYNGMANGILWPAFHGIQPETFSEKAWKAYVTVNKLFADAIAAKANPQDLIWIHDFHLLLVPALLRELGLRNKIGLFLHIPFAGQQHLAFPHNRELLEGLLGCSLLGVQTESDAQKLTACLRDLFPAATLPAIRSFPIGIDYQLYHDAHKQPDVRALFEDIQKATTDQYVVVSISRLDYTKGIITQLRAVERAVKSGLKNTHYKLIVAPSRESVGAYKTLKNDIDTEVSRLQKELPGVIDYQYRNTPFNEVCAWFIRADVALVAPLIDGMNLVAKEYFAAKPESQAGVLILSTKAGAAAQLSQALLVDPTDENAMAKALLQARAMTLNEQQQRAKVIRQNLSEQDVFWWAKNFITSLDSSG